MPRIVQDNLQYRRIRPEYKSTDVAVVGASSTTTAVIQSLTAFMAHNTGTLNGFIGGNIDPMSIQVRLSVIAGQSSAFIPAGPDTSNLVRVVVFQWLGDTTPGSGDIFQALTTQGVYSPWQINSLDKLNILMDKTYSTYLTCFQTGVASSTTSGNSIYDNRYIKGRKMAPIHFNNAGNAPTGNDIYLCHISDSSVSPHPTFSYYTRLTFVD